jgi:hypothetical protein
MYQWFHKTVPYLVVLKRVHSLSLTCPFLFSIDELLNLLCVFMSLQSVLLFSIYISDWTWSLSWARRRPRLSEFSGYSRKCSSLLLWNHPESELMDSFLQPSAGIIQHLHITFRRWNASGSDENYLFSCQYHLINSCEQHQPRAPCSALRITKVSSWSMYMTPN